MNLMNKVKGRGHDDVAVSSGVPLSGGSNDDELYTLPRESAAAHDAPRSSSRSIPISAM